MFLLLSQGSLGYNRSFSKLFPNQSIRCDVSVRPPNNDPTELGPAACNRRSVSPTKVVCWGFFWHIWLLLVFVFFFFYLRDLFLNWK